MNAVINKQIIYEDIQEILSRDLPWQLLSGCRVVVTGAGGFLGGYLVRTLLALNYSGKVSEPLQVLALVRNEERARLRLSDCADVQLEFMHWDLSDIAVPDLGECHYVIHAASQASPRYYGRDPVGTLMPNVVGTASLLHAMRRTRSPRGFLFVSSSEVYGRLADGFSLKETEFGQLDPTTQRACYAESKRLGETLCVAWHQQFGLKTYIVRPFHTYGPSLLENDGRVFADFIENVIRGENIKILGHGEARRAFCYVSDAIAGFFTVLFKGEPATAYNVANPAGELTVTALAELLVGLFPEKNLEVEHRSQGINQSHLPNSEDSVIPDVDRLTNLQWSARMNPQQGFIRTIEAYSI